VTHTYALHPALVERASRVASAAPAASFKHRCVCPTPLDIRQRPWATYSLLSRLYHEGYDAGLLELLGPECNDRIDARCSPCRCIARRERHANQHDGRRGVGEQVRQLHTE
jgi:hypothetical protein